MNNIAVFQTSIDKTYHWIDELAETLSVDRKRAYKALKAVLHTLRDVMTIEETAQFSAQLPLLLKGVFYDSWSPTGKPLHLRDKDSFLAHVYHELHPGFDVPRLDNVEVTKAVLLSLSSRISEGELEDIKVLLAKPIKALWEESLTS